MGELVGLEEGLCIGESVDVDKINWWASMRGRIGQRGAGRGRIGGLCRWASHEIIGQRGAGSERIGGL